MKTQKLNRTPITPMEFVVSQALVATEPAPLNQNELKGKFGLQIIRMHRVENMRFSEIASQLRISPQNVGRIYNQITGEKSRF
ncbi:hypothetical protein L1889_18005 [Paenalcaligenes niemegkensis]|uniref:hypothetical protein n=1 Tax=Paenalcaligenes niemegkensis TaxID=2895469 RepID=UPI001EE8C906|nr:hypothetical protein [Paenalcaligenes niemegkensis]MCQ9618334.1 hypothetical protein [Paenalcaligenes niemegkensis]